MSFAIGIDLGTTNSCISVFMNDSVKIIPKTPGENTMPSMYGIVKGVEHVGDSALYKLSAHPKCITYECKRLLGHKFSHAAIKDLKQYLAFSVEPDNKDRCVVVIDDQGQKTRMLPEVVAGKILKKLKDIAEDYLDREVTKVVITVPSYFNDLQRRITKDAGKFAELEVISIINEPTAAAIAYGYDHMKEDDENILVFDMGGGTFDVTIVEMGDGCFEEVFTEGDNFLGGNDFDNAISRVYMEAFESKHGVCLKNNDRAKSSLKRICENAKKRLSNGDSAEVRFKCKASKKEHTYTFTRNQFEALIKPKVDKAIQITKNLMKHAKLKVSDIHRVLLVGGSTYIPYVRRQVEKLFGKNKIVKGINPDESVAIGASIYSARENKIKIKKLPNCIINKSIPLSLGTDTIGGKFSKIIKRGSVIPCSKIESYVTTKDNQKTVFIGIYQGEDSENIEGNALIQQFYLNGLPALPKGEAKINVEMLVDKDSILHVTAKCVQNESEFGIKIKYDRQQLSEAEIDQLVKKERDFRHKNKDKLKLISEKIKLETLIEKIKANVSDPRNKDLMTKSEANILRKEVETKAKWKSENPFANNYQIKIVFRELNAVWIPILNSMKHKHFSRTKTNFDANDLVGVE